MLKELNVISGGKLMEEAESASASGFSAAALGRSERMMCAKSSGTDYALKLVKPISAAG